MPPALHPHLKRGWDFDDLHADPDDTIEPAPSRGGDPSAHEAKRQRVERIAARYLQGKLPVLLSSGLRGPFNSGWRNPWAVEKEKKQKRRASDKEGRVNSRKTGGLEKTGLGRTTSMEAKRPTRSSDRKTLDAPPVASPETSRAVDQHSESIHESHTLTEIEVPPATAPLPDEHDTSGATEFFSAETAQCVRNRSPLTDPFWLRRPESEGNFDMRKSTNGTTEISPTRSRGTLPAPDRRRTLQLAVPKVPVGLRAPPAETDPLEDFRSSASASMVMSSPTDPIAYAESTGAFPAKAQRCLQNNPIETYGFVSENQFAQEQSGTTSISTIAPSAHEEPLANATACPEPTDSDPGQSHISLPHRSQERPTQEDQCSSERPGDMRPISSCPASQAKPPPKAPSHQDLRPLPTHTMVASPAPNSSTGFVYKKLGGTKWTISSAPRSKPRAVNFNSSPVNKQDTAMPSKTSSQESHTAKDSAVTNVPPLHNDALSQRKDEAGGDDGQQSRRTSHCSRQSAMSTQAAMLLAQLEFQESTFPTSLSETSRPWSQTEESTPQPILPVLSPAITPLSVFRPQIEQPHALTSVLRGPAVSTQDLFAAASPFAFSTVKKKPEALQRSNLRVTLTPVHGRNRGSTLSPDSPIYTDRIPLKEKSMTPSPWNFSFDKGSRASQDSLKSSTRRPAADVELPQLDLHTSLDDYGFDGSLHFADRLLSHFNDP
jgi:hypothetical protein